MTIAFVDPISEIFYRKIILCNNLNDVIDVCAKNIFDFFFFFFFFSTQSFFCCLQSRKL